MVRKALLGLVITGIGGCYPFLWPGGDGAPSPDTDTDGYGEYGYDCDMCPDEDGDGYGDKTRKSEAIFGACGPGAMKGRGPCYDCNDAAAAIHPDRNDVCDLLDNDCDGEIDEESSTTTFVPDADGDGFPAPITYDPDNLVWACMAPPGYLSMDGEEWLTEDCDDNDPDVYPGAFEWYDGVEQDCDYNESEILGIDQNFVTFDHVLTSIDYASFRTQAFADLNGDGASDLVLGNPDDQEYTVEGGIAYVLYGPLPASGAVEDLAVATLRGDEPYGMVGQNALVAGTDGAGNILLAAALYDDTSVRVWTGATLPAAISVRDDAVTWSGPNWSNGWTLSVGDLTGDKGADLVVGNRDYQGVSYDAGIANVVLDPAAGGSIQSEPGLYGTQSNQSVGWAVGHGDVDGDGIDDLITSDDSRVYAQLGPVAALVSTGQADITLDVGSWPTFASGDLNGDGYGDLVVADATAEYTKGQVWMVHGPLADAAVDAIAVSSLIGDAFGDALGEQQSDPGDFDGDGFADPVVGSQDGYYVIDGAASGALTTADAMILSSWRPALADFDGDGKHDLFLGQYYQDFGVFDGRARP